MNTRFFSLSPLYRFCRKYMVVLLFLGLAAIPSTTRAQWSVGGKAGINWSTVRYPKNVLNDKASYIVGGQAGVVATYTCNTYFDLQLELLYATHGYKDKTLIFNDERGDTMYKGYSYRIHYIDIPLLVKHYLDLFAKENGKDIGITETAMASLCAYRWPGNIRELRNCVERMVVLCRGKMIDLENVPVDIREGVTPGISKVVLSQPSCDLECNEKMLIERALNECGGNRTKAAEKLGISRRTLHRKLHTYNLD